MSLPKLSNPVYSTKIPSGKEVSFSPFTVKDERTLLMTKESKDTRQIMGVVEEIVHNCITDKSLIGTLSYADYEHLFINMRAKSIGEVLEFNWECKHCGKTFTAGVSTDKIGLAGELEEDLTVMLQDKIGVKIKQLGMTDVIEIIDNNENDPIKIVMGLIDTVFTPDSVFKFSDFTNSEREEFLNSLSVKNLSDITTKSNSFPKCQLKDEKKCPHCGEMNEIVVEGIDNFFM